MNTPRPLPAAPPMPRLLPNVPPVPPVPRAHPLAALLAIVAALAVVPRPASAADSGRALTHRTAARVRARTRGKAHTKAHSAARARTRVHARAHAHLRALTTVASPGEVESGGASLRGSHAAVDRAYDAAVRANLPFVRSTPELAQRAVNGEYVPLELATATYRLKGVGSPYVRPATRDFVTRFAADYARACGEPLTVTSAMRPSAIHLRNSVEKTVHPTGMAVDLRAPRTSCRGWMRTTLLGLERAGTIDATEEHHPAHFHVVVLP